MTTPICESAALYALGALDPADVRDFEGHLKTGCSSCDSEVAALAGVVGELALAAPPMPASNGVRERLLAEVRKQEPSPTLATSGLGFMDATTGAWIEVEPGIFRKDLVAGGDAASSSYLIRMLAGAVAKTHIHACVEHCYVIEGDLVVGDRTLGAGDFHLAGRATEHVSLHSVGGCELLIVESPA